MFISLRDKQQNVFDVEPTTKTPTTTMMTTKTMMTTAMMMTKETTMKATTHQKERIKNEPSDQIQTKSTTYIKIYPLGPLGRRRLDSPLNVAAIWSLFVFGNFQ